MPGLLEEIKKRTNRPTNLLPLADDDTTIIAPSVTTPNGGPGTGESLVLGKAPKANGNSETGLLTSTFMNQGDAPTCPNCGHVAVRNGACYKCLNCGESLGCS